MKRRINSDHWNGRYGSGSHSKAINGSRLPFTVSVRLVNLKSSRAEGGKLTEMSILPGVH